MHTYDVFDYNFELKNGDGDFQPRFLKVNGGEEIEIFCEEGATVLKALSVQREEEGQVVFVLKDVPRNVMLSNTLMSDNSSNSSFLISKAMGTGIGIHDERDVGKLAGFQVDLEQVSVAFERTNRGLLIHFSGFLESQKSAPCCGREFVKQRL